MQNSTTETMGPLAAQDRPFILSQFILLILIWGAIFLLPYMRTIYYDQMLEYLAITPIQFGSVLVLYGITSTIGTFFSGLMADRFSAKWLLVASLALTGAGGVLLLLKPGYHGFMFIYILWGMSITFTYNSAHYKAVRYTGSAKQQGKLYGSVMGVGRMVTGLISLAAAGLFAYLATQSAMRGFTAVVALYTSMYLVIAVAVVIFWKNRNQSEAEEDRWSLRDSLAVFKHPATWYMGFVVYFVYAMVRCCDLVAPYMGQVMDISQSNTVFLNTVRSIIFPMLAGVCMGIILDRSRDKIKVCQLAAALAAISMLVLIVIPVSGTFWHSVFFMVLGLAMIGQFGGFYTAFSLLEEANIPKKITGTIVGVSVSIGYLPDITVNYLSNYLAQTYGFDAGTHYLFAIGAAHGAIAIIIYALFKRYLTGLNRPAAGRL